MATEFIKNADISDILIERPISFSVKGRRFLLYHPTLGKLQLMSRLFEAIGLVKLKPSDNIEYFCYTVAHTHKGECVRLIAYSTLPGDECLDEGKVRERIKALKGLDAESLATILITILTMDKAEEIKKYFGIDKEAERMEKAARAKDRSDSSFDFGGKSIWGCIIDTACERYGWSFQYVLWGISYANLRLLLADYIKTIFLTEKERKRAHFSDDSTVIRADEKETLEAFIKTQSWR